MGAWKPYHIHMQSIPPCSNWPQHYSSLLADYYGVPYTSGVKIQYVQVYNATAKYPSFIHPNSCWYNQLYPFIPEDLY